MNCVQLERLYHKAYKRCSMKLFGTPYETMDWPTLYVLSQSWHKTLKQIHTQRIAKGCVKK